MLNKWGRCIFVHLCASHKWLAWIVCNDENKCQWIIPSLCSSFVFEHIFLSSRLNICLFRVEHSSDVNFRLSFHENIEHSVETTKQIDMRNSVPVPWLSSLWTIDYSNIKCKQEQESERLTLVISWKFIFDSILLQILIHSTLKLKVDEPYWINHSNEIELSVCK